MSVRSTAKGLYHLVRLVRNPNLLDEVFDLAEDLSASHLEVLDRMIAHARTTPRGAEALSSRPSLGRPSVAELLKLPEGTLGRTYADNMTAQGLDPAAIPVLEVTNERTFMRSHLYETHDVWHAVTGFHTDVAGELGLQAFYAAQLPGALPIALLTAGMMNTLFFSFEDRERRLEQISRGWLMGKQADALFGVRWAEWWSRPLADVRAELKIEAMHAQALQQAA